MALRAAVYSETDHSLMAHIAEKNCWNITTFRNSLCPTTTTHKANIYHLEAVLAKLVIQASWTVFVLFTAMRVGLSFPK